MPLPQLDLEMEVQLPSKMQSLLPVQPHSKSEHSLSAAQASAHCFSLRPV